MKPMSAGGGIEEEQPSAFGAVGALAQGLKHPVCALFHLLFKTLAILVYLFGSWFSSSFVNIFIVCILLLAFDFWTVKNVSGRLMVGLRWTSEVQQDGSTVWRYESQEDLATSTLDAGVFWVGLFAPALVWFVLGVGSLFRFSFDWLLLILTALSLSMANIIGYVRCKKDAGTRIASGIAGLAGKTGLNPAMSGVVQNAAASAFGF